MVSVDLGEKCSDDFRFAIKKRCLVMIENKFFTWIRGHGGTLVEDPVLGIYHKSIGQRLYDQGRDLWVQVSRHPSKDAAHLFMSSMKRKDLLRVQAPRTIDIQLLDEHHVGHVMTFVDSPPLSRSLFLGELAPVSSFF